jgi:hypothetical protein
MQLGTRWDVGATPPARLDAEVLAAIAEVEAALPAEAAGLRWTLTWLEGRPVAELDDGATVTIVRYGWDGLEVVTED